MDELIRELTALRGKMLELEREGMTRAARIHPSYQPSARNLLHYLAMRQHDLRHLQHRLTELGLSSLGRAEAHVLSTVESLLAVLHRLASHSKFVASGREAPVDVPGGKALLKHHTEALLGPQPACRSVRIMVTMPGEAADDPALVRALVQGGMDCMRINCAHDDISAWQRMIGHLRSAERELGKRCRVLMDLAGPKLRTGPIESGARVVKWSPQRDEYGRVITPARVWLFPQDGDVPPPSQAEASLPVPRDWLTRLNVGDRINFVDQRGARRFLWVVGADGDCRWAEAIRTAYVAPGTTLVLGTSASTGKHADPLTAQVGQLPAREQMLLLKPGDTLILTKELRAGRPARFDGRGELLNAARIGCTLPEVFADMQPGQRIWMDDGKIGGVIESVESDHAVIKITQARPRGENLRADKGINLPDTTLRLPALTDKDIADLPFVAAHADLVGYSFVRTEQDIDELEARLVELNGGNLGMVLKIETREAFEHLPSLLLAAMRTPCDGVMIARGDLAIECGYERLAEVQEEILWICEAAHLPVIWATQVLEGLAKKGKPSRAEISDATSGQRAECVMLNKGPHIVTAVRTLDDILRRMEAHQSKKRSMLKPLEMARRFLPLDAPGNN